MYKIEIKKNRRTSYSKDKSYLCFINRDFIHITTEIEDAGIFKKGHLKKIYKRFGRENVIKHLIKK